MFDKLKEIQIEDKWFVAKVVGASIVIGAITFGIYKFLRSGVDDPGIDLSIPENEMYDFMGYIDTTLMYKWAALQNENIRNLGPALFNEIALAEEGFTDNLDGKTAWVEDVIRYLRDNHKEFDNVSDKVIEDMWWLEDDYLGIMGLTSDVEIQSVKM